MQKIVKAFSGGSAPKIQTIVAPQETQPATPLPDEEAMKKAAMADLMRKRNTGRQSTILTDSEDTL